MPVTPYPPRLDNEPPEWYSRFKEWLDLPRPRSFLEIYNREREGKGQKRADNPPGSWRDKPELYRWRERADEWDAKESFRMSEELAARRAKWVDRETRIAEMMVEKAEQHIKEIPLFRGKRISASNGDIYELKGDPVAFKAAVYALEVGSRIGRAALGIPDISRFFALVSKYKIPYDVLTTEQCERIYAGADPLEVVIDALATMAQKQKTTQD